MPPLPLPPLDATRSKTRRSRKEKLARAILQAIKKEDREQEEIEVAVMDDSGEKSDSDEAWELDGVASSEPETVVSGPQIVNDVTKLTQAVEEADHELQKAKKMYELALLKKRVEELERDLAAFIQYCLLS